MAKTLHRKLITEGFNIAGIFKESELPEKLAQLAVNLARIEENNIQIVSGELALREYLQEREASLTEPIYIVYSKKPINWKNFPILLYFGAKKNYTGLPLHVHSSEID
jgi:hypothetical protein